MTSHQQQNNNNNNKSKKRRNNNRNRNNLDPDVKTSKALSWALRHAALDLGMTMGTDGYVPLTELLSHSHPKLRGMTLEGVQKVVTSNDKQRFSLIQRQRDDDNTDEWFIRANQGHSIQIIDPYQLLKPIDPSSLATIVHGTYMGAWTNHIQTNGLSKMNRTHIHFAKGVVPNKENGVISGMRQSCDVFIYIDGVAAKDDGAIEFFESANGVVLTAGVDGMLPPRLFSHVLSKSGEVLLDQRTPARMITLETTVEACE
mmetsp:Transcript_438/g.683  ORF Transcript_438/g.683 Transcript_438/m.683 type:complete len:258 (-) Transcript_438:59-832(-)|eukprot:CAMPEP_0119025964 /NCGR_PEP_ID=MMETSP1176-20130426/34624_1 /TAXON_ID=265551 /ORGANISM="Synedropsis recta cf, Strain CCMP1620" /LENGTH=257 /DNA_ID=CAMNT_0006981589 /DNA_START=116 /DNA_END=889 /DNA_ORIENTATION=+